MENSQSQGGRLRIKSPQRLPLAPPVKTATSPIPPERTHSAGRSSGRVGSDLGAALLFGLGLFAAVVAPVETVALLRSLRRRPDPERPSPKPCPLTGDRCSCPRWDRCDVARDLSAKFPRAIEVRS